MKIASRIALAAIVALLLTPLMALATGKPPAPGNPSAQAEASAQGFGYGAPATVHSDSRALALPSWGGSYGGLYSVCNEGWLFGVRWKPSIECIREIAKLEREMVTHRHTLLAKDHPSVDNPLGKPSSSVAPKPEAAATAAAAPAAQRIDDATRARAAAAAKAAARPKAAPAPIPLVDCDAQAAATAKACKAKRT